MRAEADNATTRTHAIDAQNKRLEQIVSALEHENQSLQRNPDGIRDYYKTRAEAAEEKIKHLEDCLRLMEGENEELKAKLQNYESSG